MKIPNKFFLLGTLLLILSTGCSSEKENQKESLAEDSKYKTIAIFPEGTRTEEQALLPFKGGTRIIANKLELRIQPIVITNSKQLLNEHKKTAHNATVHINYLDTFQVDKSDKEWYKNLQEKMQSVIDEEKNKYERER